MPAGSAQNDADGLKDIRVDQITPNVRNPRKYFDQRKIERLAASLEEIGLQVPITVYHDPSKTKKPFVLLDGERRYRAATLIDWETIPALIVPKPSASDNAVRMFNIHMLREDWEEIETAWALEQIIEETGVVSDRELQTLTGLSPDRIKNMRRVLNFPKAIQTKVADGKLPFQLLVELDKNILSKVRDGSTAVTARPAELRDIFLKKYETKVEKDIVDLRRVGTLFETAKSTGKVGDRAKAALHRLVTQTDATIEEAYEEGASSSVEISRVLRDMSALPARTEDLLEINLDNEQRKQVLAAVAELRRALGNIK